MLELEPPVSVASQQRIWGLTQRLSQRDDILEVIPGMNNLTLILREPDVTALDVTERLQRWWEESEASVPASRDIVIPVTYGGEAGPDLAEVATHCRLTPAQVVALHSSINYLVYFIGFQPGFPYLGGLPAALHTPRRDEPRLTVPAGSVGIGGSQTGVYPLASPGGWQLIGRTHLPLFDPSSDDPVLLRPGDRVRFAPQKGGVC